MRALGASRTSLVPGGVLAGPWNRNELWRRARAVPSLDLRFADNKSLVDAVTGASLISFTRASSGTFVDSAGVLQTAATDVPRFDHNPTTGESLGLLVEEQRTNLLLRSEEFDDAEWARARSSITANTIVAPDGTLTGDKWIQNNGEVTGTLNLINNATLTDNTIYTLSVIVKAGEWNTVRLRIRRKDGSDGAVVFNIETQTFTQILNNVGYDYQELGNGWYRVWLSVDVVSGGTTTFVMFLLGTNDSVITPGDGTSGIYIWGAQLEAGSFPTSYIPTTTAAVTRSASLADLISNAIANNIRSFYVEFSSPAVGTRGVVSLNDNTSNERASVLTSGTDPRLVVQDGGVEQANINGGTVAAGVRTRVAVRINADDFAISINGGAVVTDTSGTLPTVDRLMFGRTQAGEYLNSRIARFTGWSQLLPNATLQTLAQ